MQWTPCPKADASRCLRTPRKMASALKCRTPAWASRRRNVSGSLLPITRARAMEPDWASRSCSLSSPTTAAASASTASGSAAQRLQLSYREIWTSCSPASRNEAAKDETKSRFEIEGGATMKAHLLIVDDEANTLASLSRAFRLANHEVTVADNAERALRLVKSQNFDLIFSDVVMPGKNGLAFLEEIRSQGIAIPVVMMSGQADIEKAVRATKLGALDFLEKPISSEKLLLTVENALKLQLGKHEIVWTGEAMKKIMAQLERVAASDTRVCILGETGTGKELIARTLHEKSQRASGPFIALNCAAVPAELIESELFGHEKGSFTGAAGRHVGKFEQAER